jgi:predicted small integral membrane protein
MFEKEIILKEQVAGRMPSFSVAWIQNCRSNRTCWIIEALPVIRTERLLCWWAGVRLLNSYRAERAQFAAALNIAVIALTTSLLMWLVAFLDVGGEWFLMWQSKMWNGQEEAFRMFTIVGVVFLVVVQCEPTPD